MLLYRLRYFVLVYYIIRCLLFFLMTRSNFFTTLNVLHVLEKLYKLCFSIFRNMYIMYICFCYFMTFFSFHLDIRFSDVSSSIHLCSRLCFPILCFTLTYFVLFAGKKYSLLSINTHITSSGG